MHIAADFAPYGRRRDRRVADALAEQGRELVTTGSPYAVAPGTLLNKSGGPFQVFSPFHRTWLEHGVHEPAPAVRASSVDWLEAENRVDIPPADADLIKVAGEAAALRSWHEWLEPGPQRGERLPEDERLPRTGRHLASLQRPALGTHPSPYGAARPILAALQGRARAGPTDRLAGLLRRRALAPAGCGERAGEAGVQADDVRRTRAEHHGRRAAEGLAGREDRLSAGRRRDAAAASPRAGCTTGSGWWSPRS